MIGTVHSPTRTPRTVQVTNTFGDLDTYTTEGVVEFTLGGRTLRLRPFTTRPKRFYIVFKDASSGAETYDAARFLYADLRDDGDDGARFQPGLQPAVRVQPLHDVPDSAAREPAAGEGAGGRARPIPTTWRLPAS